LCTITVQDQTAPAISGVHDMTITVPFGVTETNVDYLAPTIVENCSLTASNCTPASGSTFALGTNQVNCTAMDMANNSSSTNFLIIVTSRPPAADLGVTMTAGKSTVGLGQPNTY